MCKMICLVCISFLLLLLAGDVERNPGPTLFVTCPNCNKKIHVKKLLCECGYKINKRKGRPSGTTAKAGYKVSTGRTVGTSADAGYRVSTGRAIGTTAEAGFSASYGRPVKYESNCDSSMPTEYSVNENNLSLTDDMLAFANKRIAQQRRFDAKPLAIGMCYCCGSILWSRVDNSHTNLIDIDLTDEQIPTVSYQKALLCSGKGILEYRHKSSRLFAYAVCKTLKHPSDYKFHIGIVDEALPTEEWDLIYPEAILNLKNSIEQSQVALCGIFSTTVKDTKRHQWRHIQSEVNLLHKLDRHYYGLFGFLLINEDLNDKLAKNSEAYERIRLALHWLKRNNHLYQDFLARFETLYRYIRQEIVNLEVLKLDQNKVLESEALGLAFPVDSEYFEQYSPL